MYSSYYKPQDGRESAVLTDHEALHRDAATHRNMQSDETKLRPLDLETIMSSKAAVKFWYLHRPKTMEYVHKNATKIQSVGRAFAVRQLKKKYGIEYMVELAKADAARREADKLKELSEEDRAARAADDAAYDARVEESRRLRREQMAREREAEDALRQRLASDARRRQEAEDARLAALAVAAAEQAKLSEEERLREEEARLALLAAQEEARAEAEERRLREAEEEEQRQLLVAEEVERLRQLEAEQEAQRLREAAALAERTRREEQEAAAAAALRAEEEAAVAEERAREEEAATLHAAAAAETERQRRKQQEETERALAAAAAEAQRAEQARQQRIKEEKAAKYEQSLSKDVPVLVRNHGPGRVVNYDQEAETYVVRLDNAMGGMTITVKSSDVNLDDDRILSPRTKVDTPFGTGEVVGLDPHVGCYAINTEVGAPDGQQFLAFVQIKDVHLHVEEVEERAIVENPSMPIPDEIALVSARIVDSRVLNKTGNKFIQYKLEIRTSNYGTVYCWKRYSTFRSLCDRLHKEAGVKKKDIPELPKRQIVGNFSQKTIGERAEKLNLFLAAAVQAEHLQWGIRVDDQIAVYKRRVKKSSGGIFSRRR